MSVALLKEGGVPSDASVDLVTAALRTDATPLGLLDIVRDLKAQSRDLQRAIEQGQISGQTPRVERPPVPTRPDRPERIERPGRIDRPERPGRP